MTELWAKLADKIATPALMAAMPTVRDNIAKLHGYAREHGLKVRPHSKTHKSIFFGQLQLEAGAVGLTVAKVGEAAVMANVANDLLLAYPALDVPRRDALVRIARDKSFRVAVDSTFAAERISESAAKAGVEIGILVDVDVGMHRTGVQSPAAALELAQAVTRLPGVRLDGILCYPGHIFSPLSEQIPALQRVAAILEETLRLWTASGLEAKIVSGGSTPTAYQSHLVPGLTEIRPGTYIFNDMNTVHGGYCTIDEVAARIVCTVVSNAVPGQVVIDAGSKTLTSDRCFPAPDSGHGCVVEYPGAKITKLSEEHGQVDISGCDRVPKLGERVSVIPNHICPCVNLQDQIWLIEPGQHLDAIRVDARGRLS